MIDPSWDIETWQQALLGCGVLWLVLVFVWKDPKGRR